MNTTQYTRICLLLLMVVVLWCPRTDTHAYPVDDSVTVVTTDNDTIVAHRYEVQERFQNLKLWVGNKTVTVDRADVVSIRTSTEDITQQVHDLFDGKPTAEEMAEQERRAEAPNAPPESPYVNTGIWVDGEQRIAMSVRLRYTDDMTISAQRGSGMGGEIVFHLKSRQRGALSLIASRTTFFKRGDAGLSALIGYTQTTMPRTFSSEGVALYYGGAVGISRINISESHGGAVSAWVGRLYVGVVPMISNSLGLDFSLAWDQLTEFSDDSEFGTSRLSISAGLIF